MKEWNSNINWIITLLLIFLLITFLFAYKATATEVTGGWSIPTQITTNSSSKEYYPGNLIYAENKYWFAFDSNSAGSYDIWIINSTDLVNWNDPIQVTSDPSGEHSPSLTYASGKYWIAFYGDDQDIYLTNSSDGYTWATPQQLFANASLDYEPSLFQDCSGKYWITWNTARWGGIRIAIANSTDGYNWNPEYNAGDFLGYRPALIQNCSDNVYWLAWEGFVGSVEEIFVSNSTDGFAWSPIINASANASKRDQAPSWLINTSGYYWLVWSSDRNGNYDIWYSTSRDGIGWESAVQITTNASNDMYASLFQDPYGVYWLTWALYGAGYDIWISKYDPIPPLPITNLTNISYATTYINWTWTNPVDADFNHTMVYIDGAWEANVSTPYYNDTGLNANTTYNISTHTVDTSGNINSTWVNATASTSFYPPPSITDWSNNKTNNQNLSITVNESELVNFNVTANQSITTYSWYKDGAEQGVNYDNYTTSWAVNGSYEVNASVQNVNGTSTNKSWAITVNDITAPVVSGLTNDTPTQTTVNLTWSCDATDVLNYSVYQNGTFLENTTSKYYNVTGLSANTTYEFNVSATDDNDLKGANATINITTAPYPTCSAQGGSYCSSAQSCSGNWVNASDTTRCCIGRCYYPSSGGDGGYSPTPTPTPPVTITITKEVGNMEAGKSKVVTFEEPELDISDIKINVKNNVSGVEITIQKLSGAPPEIKTTPPPTIIGATMRSYSYLNISTHNITDDDIKNASVNFTVSKSWIDENEIDENLVRLNRYNTTTSNWTALPTNKTGEDDVSVYYSALSPGFSIFAITGEKAEGKEEATPTPTPTSIPTITPTLASTVTATPVMGVGSPTPMITATPSSKGWSGIPAFEITLAIAGLLIITYLLRRRK